MSLELSVKQDHCTSCGLCEEAGPRHFFMAEDGLAYVKEGISGTPNIIKFVNFEGKVAVASELENAVIDIAEECPGECIIVEAS